MTPKIYAYTGTHGTGKSTAAYKLAHQFKITNPGKEVGLLMEVARQCPLPILAKGQNPTEEAQRWIFGKQLSIEIEMATKFDIVVADRTIVDTIAYTTALGFIDLANAMLGFIQRHMAIFKEIRMLKAIDMPLIDDGLRHMDEGIRREVERHLILIYKMLGIKIIMGEP